MARLSLLLWLQTKSFAKCHHSWKGRTRGSQHKHSLRTDVELGSLFLWSLRNTPPCRHHDASCRFSCFVETFYALTGGAARKHSPFRSSMAGIQPWTSSSRRHQLPDLCRHVLVTVAHKHSHPCLSLLHILQASTSKVSCQKKPQGEAQNPPMKCLLWPPAVAGCKLAMRVCSIRPPTLRHRILGSRAHLSDA